MSAPTTPENPGDGARCFLALLPDAASRSALRGLRESLDGPHGGGMRGVRWLDTASVHLTLRFLGESTYAQIESLKAGLPALACATNRIEGRRLAIWPNRVRPRLLVLELEASDGLLALARECEALAREAGFPPEPRRFKPHMTLARLRPGCAPGVLPPTSLAITFDAVALVQSMLAHPAATYRELARVPLAAPAHDAEDHGQSGHG